MQWLADVVLWGSLAAGCYFTYRNHKLLDRLRADTDRLQTANRELKMLNEAYAFMLAQMGVTVAIDKQENGLIVHGRAPSPKLRPH